MEENTITVPVKKTAWQPTTPGVLSKESEKTG